jgi:internalin A
MKNAEIWDRFEDVMRRKSPVNFEALRPPASAAAIAAAEKAMKIKFPAELRDAYLRHDGANRGTFESKDGLALFDDCRWCGLDEMVDYWSFMVREAGAVEMDDPDFYMFPINSPSWDRLAIRPEWWNKKWLPIGRSNTANTYYIDLMPGPRGTKGQIISDSGEMSAALIAPGLNAWLTFLSNSFESGRFITEPGSGRWIDTLHGADAQRSFCYYGRRSDGAVS